MILKSTLINSFINELRRTFSIKGRTSRNQYLQCWFIIFNLLLVFVYGVYRLMLIFPTPDEKIFENMEYPFLVLVIFICIFLITLSIRRVHDLGHGGWFILLKFIPILGFFVLLYMCFRAGKTLDNKYGLPAISDKLSLLDKIWIYSLIILSLLDLSIVTNSLSF